MYSRSLQSETMAQIFYSLKWVITLHEPLLVIRAWRVGFSEDLHMICSGRFGLGLDSHLLESFWKCGVATVLVELHWPILFKASPDLTAIQGRSPATTRRAPSGNIDENIAKA